MSCDFCHHRYCGECAGFLSCEVCGQDAFLCQNDLRIRQEDPCGCGDALAVVCETCYRSDDVDVEKLVKEAQTEGERRNATDQIRALAQTFGFARADLISWISNKATKGPALANNTATTLEQ